MLHAERADRPARSDARDRVRHVNADALLAHHDRADVGIGGIFNEMIDRIAAEDFDPLPLHDFRNGGAELHDGLSPGLQAGLVRSLCKSRNRIFLPGKARVGRARGSADMRFVAQPKTGGRREENIVAVEPQV